MLQKRTMIPAVGSTVSQNYLRASVRAFHLTAVANLEAKGPAGSSKVYLSEYRGVQAL